MFSGVISSARSPSHTKMMTLRGVGPSGCGVAASRPNPSTTSDKMIRKMNLFIFMGDLVSFEGGRSPAALLIVQMTSTTADPHRGSSPSRPLVIMLRPTCLAEHGGDLLPAVDPAQPDPPAGHEAEEQDHRRVLGGQRALRFHASAKFLMEPLNRVGGSQRLPLLFREPEERQELLAAFPQARHHTRAALAPGALEERVGSASRLSIGRVDDSMGSRRGSRQARI